MWNLVVKCIGHNRYSYGCGVILEIERNDLFLKYSFNNLLFYIKCPCCNNLININDFLIPTEIRKKLLSIKKYEIMKEVI